MTTTADQERYDRVWCDGDLWNDGDLPAEPSVEPEPFTAPVSLRKSEGACTRPRIGRRGQRCGGPIVDGRCVLCRGTRRVVER